MPRPAQPRPFAALSATLLPVAALLASPAFAQQQQQKPPIATYWVSAETTSGFSFGQGGTPDIAAMMGGGGGSSRYLHLQLGSQLSAKSSPSADHAIPTGMKMGAALPLRSPEKVAPSRPERDEEDVPQEYERPKGRLLIYWGCGDETRPGQPVVIDFAKLADGGWPRGLFSRAARQATPPSPDRHRGYGEWPNRDDSRRVPADASLIGAHAVTGNYSPDIRFSVAERNDFLAPVALDASTTTARGGIAARWQAVPNALGYFASVMGASDGGDMVWWSSSETQVSAESLMSWLPPDEVARLLKEKTVMPPERTECVVPKDVASVAAGGGMLRFIAYGNELNLIHPPRPQDPKVVWEPEWAVKVRNKSTATTLLGQKMDMGSRRGGRAAPDDEEAGTPHDGATGGYRAAEPAPAPLDPADAAVREGTRAIRGLFGF